MQLKILEVRDRATFIPVIAISTDTGTDAQWYYLRRCGFGNGPQIIVTYLSCRQPAYSDPYDWNGRTMAVAHQYIETHFHTLKDGDVIDVEHILQETSSRKISERLSAPLS